MVIICTQVRDALVEIQGRTTKRNVESMEFVMCQCWNLREDLPPFEQSVRDGLFSVMDKFVQNITDNLPIIQAGETCNWDSERFGKILEPLFQAFKSQAIESHWFESVQMGKRQSESVVVGKPSRPTQNQQLVP